MERTVTSDRERTGSIFTVTFRAPAGSAGIHPLRALLKTALRRFGLRAIDMHEENTTATAPDTTTQIADAFGQLRRDVNNRLRREQS
jgi:hypothetical protein